MNKLSLRLLCQVYVLLVLLAATITSAPPYSLLALVLLLVILFTTLRPLQARIDMVITVATVFLLPQVSASLLNYLTLLAPTTGQITSAISVLPVIYLLDYNLRQNAQDTRTFIREKTKGRYITNISKALFASTLVILLVSLITDNPVLLFTGIIFALYLLGILIRVFLAIPRLPLDAPTMRKRVIAGTTADISLELMSKAAIRIHSLISPVDNKDT